MKKISTLVTILVILAVVGTALAETSAIPGSGWWSGEQIQNVGTGTGSIDITAYDSASTATFTKSDSLNPGEAKNYGPGDFTGMPSGFQGSAIVSSNQDIRAVVNITNLYVPGTSPLGDILATHPGAAQYQGTNEPSTTLAFPLVKRDRGGKNTTLYVQNAGTAAATFSATFLMKTGSSTTYSPYSYTSPSVGPGQMVVFSALDTTSPVPANSVGSVLITSSQPLAGTVLESFTAETHASLLQGTRFFTPSDYDTKAYVPIFKKARFNRFTGLQVQNVTAGPSDITVDYKGSAGACAGIAYQEKALNVAAGEKGEFLGVPIPNDCAAAATISATGNVVGVVNEAFIASYIATGKSQEATMYSTLPNSKATTVISLPLYKEDANSKQTGVNIMNVGAVAATNVVITIKSVNLTPNTFVSQPLTIQPGAKINLIDLRNQAAGYWNGTSLGTVLLPFCSNSLPGCSKYGNLSMVITSDQPVVAVADESTYPNLAPRKQQDKNNYEGFNLATAP